MGRRVRVRAATCSLIHAAYQTGGAVPDPQYEARIGSAPALLRPNPDSFAEFAPTSSDRLLFLDETVFDQPKVFVPDEPDSRSVVLVLLCEKFDAGGLLHFHASGKRPCGRLARLCKALDLRPVHCHAGRELLVVLHLQCRRSGHDQAGLVAVRAREPRAVALDHLAVFVKFHVFAKIEDVLRLRAYGEVIPGDLVQFSVFPFLLLDDSSADSIDHPGLAENGDLELRAASFQNELKARLEDEVWITARRQQLAARELELLLPRRALGRALAARHGKRENRRHSKYRFRPSHSGPQRP